MDVHGRKLARTDPRRLDPVGLSIHDRNGSGVSRVCAPGPFGGNLGHIYIDLG
jgi:hypothetical protein